MPRKPKAVPLSKVDDIQASLKQKAATPKTISLSDLILSLAKPIQDMLDAGYDYSDVADVFKGHGVELAASGLKSFHKKASTSTDNISSNESNSLAIDSQVDNGSESSSTDSSTVTNDSASTVELGSSSTDSSEISEPSPSQTTKRKKPKAETSSQFNVTDRSNV
ncbi:hypothetical protein FNW02_28755 [Komarekiella sp. 'clone 1']|uniref:Uncharacterized protein n=1 Tax=Komarekiella delphini-convector SJRDD-AB1 TaxID=2593771 RepID=A0AA40T2W9_9NOST|nr:hypothetical protein [Komarekiella delphini-convector]MBD6619700.1 hypothetical protein [Komarekiella delphini-convector SJRDD-AB1]